MKLILEMDLDDAEFHGDGDPDADPDTADGHVVAAHLERIAARVRDGNLAVGESFRVKSLNGSKIGALTVQGD